MTSLKNQLAVITGAGSGIGRQITLSLARNEMRLFLLGRNMRALDEVSAEALKTTCQATCYNVDLISEEDIQRACDLIRKKTHRVDVLIHSAGTISLGPLESAPIADFDRQYHVNIRAPFLLTQRLLPMLKAGQGQVVFINSSAGLNASANFSQYAATKSALKALADSFRQEINPAGVRVLSVYPGRTASRMQAEIFKMEGREYHPELLIQPSDIAEIVLTALTLPRSAEITEINVRPFSKSY